MGMPSILVVDDEAVNRGIATVMLTQAGWHVDAVEDGPAAIAAVERRDYALVLMDIQMPEMDGMEATAVIRKLEKNSGHHIPILAMTAHAMRGDRERCLASGMDGYISKPIHPSEVFAEIRRCLAAREGSNAMEDNSRQTVEQIDRAALLDRVEGDRELLTQMIHLFQQDAPNLLSAMRAALSRGDAVTLERSAHSLKGAAGSLSAKMVTAAAAQLEHDAKKKDLKSAKGSLVEVERSMKQLEPALAELCAGVSK